MDFLPSFARTALDDVFLGRSRNGVSDHLGTVGTNRVDPGRINPEARVKKNTFCVV